jgi:hypothetical protein
MDRANIVSALLDPWDFPIPRQPLRNVLYIKIPPPAAQISPRGIPADGHVNE